MPHPDDYVCDACGSTNVQMQAWVDANTGEMDEYVDGGMSWCCDCGDETTLSTHREWAAQRMLDEREDARAQAAFERENPEEIIEEQLALTGFE
jgi:hypothetical protein